MFKLGAFNISRNCEGFPNKFPLQMNIFNVYTVLHDAQPISKLRHMYTYIHEFKVVPNSKSPNSND
jgi:hypothetical protein